MTDSELPHGPFPFSWTELSEEENGRIKAAVKAWPFDDMIRYSENVVLPRVFQSIADKLYNFEVKEDDIWIVTYPKCGTTWTQEMIWQLVNNVDMEKGQMPLFTRSPFIEMACIAPPPHMTPEHAKPELQKKMTEFGMKLENASEAQREGMLSMMKFMSDPIEYTRTLSGRRVIKCHLPMDLLPHDVINKCKIVYVARNPKDCAVSYFHHCKLLQGWVADFDECLKQFEDDLLLYGSYWRHILGGWEYKDNKNVSFIWFEEMKKDQKSVIQSLCHFLDHPLAEGKVDELVENLKFDKMKKNMAVNMVGKENDKPKGEFMRKGIVGDWKNHFDEETEKRWNQWIEKNIQGKNIIIPGK